MNNLLSPTIFSEEAKDGERKSSVNEEATKESKEKQPEMEMNDETKERAGSLPPIAPRENKKKHIYTEIPEPGELLKNKALSTGRFLKSWV